MGSTIEIHEMIKNLVDKHADENGKDTTKTAGEFKVWIKTNLNVNVSAIQASDFCYNRYNEGLKENFPRENRCLVYLEDKKTYQLVGTNYDFTGLVTHKSRETNEKTIVGFWENGKPYFNRSYVKKGYTDGISIRTDELSSCIKLSLKGTPADVKTNKDVISISIFDNLICEFQVEFERYRIFNVCPEWSERASYTYEKDDNNTCFCYFKTINECLDELLSLFAFEAQK